MDTTLSRTDIERSDDFYEKLESRMSGSRFSRFIYRAMVSEDRYQEALTVANPQMVKETDYYRRFEGKTIGEIRIYRNNVFDTHSSTNGVREWLNRMHVVTREPRVRNNLLFQEGETVNAETFARNEQLLRALDYLSDAYIVIRESGEEEVIVHVFTRDRWSVGVDIESVIKSRYLFDLFDKNIVGTGNRFSVKTFFSLKERFYGGNVVSFEAANIRGTFIDYDLVAGKGYDEFNYGVGFNKNFIQPADYMAGGRFEIVKEYDRLVTNDSLFLVKYRNIDGWVGKSWESKKFSGSFFLSGRFQDMDYIWRPQVEEDLNTRYHSRKIYMASYGFYRELFYRGNMIYGFGVTEDVPYGQKFQVTHGYYQGEFGSKWYAAADLSIGRQTSFGYFRGQAIYSTFLNTRKNHMQRALEINLSGFSNLLKIRRSYLRQFFNIDYLHGFNRLKGEGETLIFSREDSPRGLHYQKEYGMVRLILRNESVVFTPVYLYGFRFAFFGFLDFGWLGDHNFVLKNDFYTTVGIGIRLRNERLVLNTISIRLGLAVSLHGLPDYRYVQLSTESRLGMPGFKPDKPDIFDFR